MITNIHEFANGKACGWLDTCCCTPTLFWSYVRIWPVRVYYGTCSLTRPGKSCFSLSKSAKSVLASIMQSLSANWNQTRNKKNSSRRRWTLTYKVRPFKSSCNYISSFFSNPRVSSRISPNIYKWNSSCSWVQFSLHQFHSISIPHFEICLPASQLPQQRQSIL